MHATQIIVVLAAFAALGVSANAPFQAGKGAGMSTNIAVLAAAEWQETLNKAGATVIDPSKLLEGANAQANDIVEDPTDPFITSRSGKPRPNFVNAGGEWAEAPVSKQQPSLRRVKRCGGDDDGDAERARRARRARRNRARRERRARRRAERRAMGDASTTTTTVRKVIQDGKVVSTSVIPQATVVQHQPVAQQQPVVQTVAAPQPVVVQQQPAQQVVAAPQPQQQAVKAPSISVQGSVKVN